jgi:hypothetical protein
MIYSWYWHYFENIFFALVKKCPGGIRIRPNPPRSASVMQDYGSTTPIYRQNIEWRLVQVWLRERKHCNLCDVVIDSIRLAKIHFNSRLHREAAGRSSHQRKIFLDRLCFSTFLFFFYIPAVLHIAGVSRLENNKGE